MSSGTDFKRELNFEEINRREVQSESRQSPARSEIPLAGTKFDDTKTPLAILPIEALEEIGKVLGFGAKKYAADNWRRGISHRRLLGAALRHIFAFLRGEENDPESGRSHLAHAACCVMFCLTFVLEKREDLDDRYKKT